MSHSYPSVFAALIGLVIIGGINCQTDCHSPPIVANANYTMTGLTTGSIATYTCYPGFRAAGSSQRTCRTGVWVNSVPAFTCTALYCPRPPTIVRGSSRTLSNGYFAGTVATYTCYTGYVINGTSAEITCQVNQTWSSPVPWCSKRDCGPPQLPDNGNTSFTSTDYYSSAIYTCQTGYTLYSNGYVQRSERQSVRCLSSGLWATTPTCRPKDCRLPSNIYNGIRYTQGNHVYGQSVTYECVHGYIIHGNSTITCLATGSWSLKPECKRVECDDPPTVANATTAKVVSKAFYGNSTLYNCNKGFELNGSPRVSCQSDGTWTQPPSCTLVNCRTPPSIHFGIHTWINTTYMSKADYICDDGYTLIGVPEIHCQPDGRWTPAPTCEHPPGYTAPPSASKSGQAAPAEKSSALTGLAVACAFFGVISLICIIGLIYKVFLAGKTDKLFSYASYKNGEDSINGM